MRSSFCTIPVTRSNQIKHKNLFFVTMDRWSPHAQHWDNHSVVNIIPNPIASNHVDETLLSDSANRCAQHRRTMQCSTPNFPSSCRRKGHPPGQKFCQRWLHQWSCSPWRPKKPQWFHCRLHRRAWYVLWEGSTSICYSMDGTTIYHVNTTSTANLNTKT